MRDLLRFNPAEAAAGNADAKALLKALQGAGESADKAGLLKEALAGIVGLAADNRLEECDARLSAFCAFAGPVFGLEVLSVTAAAAPAVPARLLEAAELAEALLARQKWRPDGSDPEAVCLRKLREAIAGVRGGGDSSPAPGACPRAEDDLPPLTPQPELVMPSVSKAWRQGDAIAELLAAHRIIRNALNIMTIEQKSEWGRRNARDGVDGDGITRANEREAIFSARSEKPAAN